MSTVIVSVHTAKAAGSSFLQQLKNLFSENEVLLDYDDDPVNPISIVNLDPARYETQPILTIAPSRVVHGHFHPQKYAYLNNAFRLTFLRHPIDNIVSIYYFWLSHERDCWDSALFHYFKDAQLTLLQFAMLPSIRYLYTRSYFGGYDMRNFDFIGDYARYDTELVRLGDILGLQFDLSIRLNVTKRRIGANLELRKERAAIVEKEHVRLAEILKEDIEFYETYKDR